MRTFEEEYNERHAGYAGDDDQRVTGWCSLCGEPCYGVAEDNGYGWTEYWGSVSFHSQIDIVSDCCGEAILDNEPMPDEEGEPEE